MSNKSELQTVYDAVYEALENANVQVYDSGDDALEITINGKVYSLTIENKD